MKRDNAIKHWPLIEAFKNGATIESRVTDWNDWTVVTDPNWRDDCQYRIKSEPKLRPWKAEEVPVGALFRAKNWANDKCTMIVCKTGIMFSVAGYDTPADWNVNEAAVYCEHSIDGGKTWQPCGIYE